MPYIPVTARKHAQSSPLTDGDLNYALTVVVQEWMTRQAPGYATIARAVAALECAKLELYARVARPYEDQKMLQNGDVYFP